MVSRGWNITVATKFEILEKATWYTKKRTDISKAFLDESS